MTTLRERIDETAAEPWAWPALDSLDEALRRARRSLVDVRHATEDASAEAVLKIRRHPLTAVGVAASAGILAGAAVGFSLGWLVRSRS